MKHSYATELVQNMLSGDIVALARLISMVERGNSEVHQILRLIHSHTGKAYRIGITGPGGAGKSTTVDKLTKVIREQNLKVGIIAVDPTSPFSGGAILGDRIRMQQHGLDEGVFIRSMATRGAAGGLPITVNEVIKLLDAAGTDVILVETVGVGQDELGIIKSTDTVIVILTPESGDGIQAMKAGLIEIADIFIVNKIDRPGADKFLLEIRNMLALGKRHEWWQVPVLATQASDNIGIDILYSQIRQHYKALRESGMLDEKRNQQHCEQFEKQIMHRINEKLLSVIDDGYILNKYIDGIRIGKFDPYLAADDVLSSGELFIALSNDLRGDV